MLKEESGIFLARDAAWASEILNDRVDRPVIRYLFDREPRAWMTVVAPQDDSAAMDLQCAQALVPMGLRISLKEAYKRFRWTPPAPGEPCLEFPRNTHPQGREEGDTTVHPRETHSLPAASSGAAPIAPGANASREPQTAAPEMPDPQVDEAGFYSSHSTEPALGYSIPNQAA